MAAEITYDNGSPSITFDVSEHYAMIDKFAKQTIYDVKTANKLKFINKGQIGNGVAIEDALVNLSESVAWKDTAQDGSKMLAPQYPDITVQYNSTWNGKQFKTTVSESQIRKTLMAGKGVEDLAAKVVSTLTASEGYEEYKECKGLLEAARDVNILPVDGDTHAIDASLLKLIKNTTDKMSYVNSDYVACGSLQSTPIDRIYIVMSDNVRNSIDIDVLAGLFNMEKAELDGKIVTIDDPGYIYIVDQYGLFEYTRLYRMTSFYVADGLYENYWLTVDRMFGSNNLFKMAYIKVEE